MNLSDTLEYLPRWPDNYGTKNMSDILFGETVHAAEGGDRDAHCRLFSMLYSELRRMAQRELRRGVAITLSPTTLLHETYLSISQRESLAFSDRGKFMSYAARAMRGLIVDHLRSRNAQKRGGEFEIISLPTEPPHVPDIVACDSIQIEKLSHAMESLARIDARLADCVGLKFFCGFSVHEIAQLRAVSPRTVQRDWDKARVLLSQLINEQEPNSKSLTSGAPLEP